MSNPSDSLTESEYSSYHSDGQTTYRSFLGLSKVSTSGSLGSEDSKGRESADGSFPGFSPYEKAKLAATNFETFSSDYTTYPEAVAGYMRIRHQDIWNGICDVAGRPTVIFICRSLRERLDFLESRNKPSSLVLDVLILRANSPNILISIHQNEKKKPDVVNYNTKVAREIIAKIRSEVVPNFNTVHGVLDVKSSCKQVVELVLEWEAEARREFLSRTLNLDKKQSSNLVQYLADHLTGSDVSTSEFLLGTHSPETIENFKRKRNADKSEEFAPLFGESELYEKMRQTLSQYGVLTLTGLPGSGKTYTAHRLGVEYTELGYVLKDVDDIRAFDINSCIGDGQKYFCVMENIFEDDENIKDVEDVLNSLMVNTYPPGTSVDKKDRKFVVVFTCQRYSLQKGLGKLNDNTLFPNDTVFDLSAINYTKTEARNIFLMQWKNHKAKPPEDTDISFVCEKGPDLPGFPLMCQLYFGSNHSLSCREFFESSIVYYRTVFDRFRKSKSSVFASFLYVFLSYITRIYLDVDQSDSGLETSGSGFNDLDPMPRYKPLAEKMRKIHLLVPGASQEDIRNEMTHLEGIYVIEDKFAEPVMYNAFTYSLINLSVDFVIDNCTLEFLCTKVGAKIVPETCIDDRNFICLSHKFLGKVAKRLERAINEGQLKLALCHPLLLNESFVETVFQNVKLDGLGSLFDEDKHLLYWTVRPNSTALVKKVVAQLNWFPDLLKKQCIRAAMSGGVQEHSGETRSELSIIDGCMFLAVEMNSLSIAEYLLNNGANLTVVNGQEENILHVACSKNLENMVETIISCNNEHIRKAISSRDSKYQTPLMIALVNGYKKIFFLLLSVGADRQLKENEDPFLHLACEGGNIDICDYLLRSNNVNSRDRYHATPLMKAALRGNFSLVEHLLSHGSDASLKDALGDLAIHYACRGGDVKTVMNLISVCDLNTPGNKGLTPLMVSALQGNDTLFQFLVDNKADLSLTDHRGNALIHHACQGGNFTIVKKVSASNVNAKGEKGRTPAMVAVENKHIEVLDFLISQNADLSRIDDDGLTTIDIALATRDPEMVTYIKSKVNINSEDAQGRTPLMSAALKGDFARFLNLVDNKANTGVHDRELNTALHYACQGGNIEIVKRLLNPFNKDKPGANGKTPLMFAAACGLINVVNYLLLENAELQMVDRGGNSVLHHACFSGKVDLAELMLPMFNVDIRGEYHWTPLMIATVCGHEGLFNYLLQKGANLSLKDSKGNTCLDLAYIHNKLSIFYLICSKETRFAQRALELTTHSGNDEVFFNLLTMRFDGKIKPLRFDNKIFLKACHGGNLKIVQYILRHESPDINARDSNGKSGVMIAAERGNWVVFKLLLTDGAKLNFIALDGSNILQLAHTGGNEEIVQLIKEKISNRQLVLEEEAAATFAHWFAR